MPARLVAPDGSAHLLATRTTIGRDPCALVHVDDESVSHAHAELGWTGSRWVLRDLVSRNGTFVNDTPAEPGKPRPLVPGDRLRFGLGKAEWRLEDGGAPAPFAVCVDAFAGRTSVSGADGVLLLPSDTRTEATLYPDDDGRWVCERHSSTGEVEAAHVVTEGAIIALSSPWRVHLGDTGGATVGMGAVPLDEVTLVLYPSRDGEHGLAALRYRGRRIPLRPGLEWCVLHALATDLLRDRDAPAHDRGWVHLDVLSEETGVLRNQIDAYVSRARAQLVKVGVRDGRGIVDGSRTGYRRLGLAPDRVVIEDPRRT